MKNITYEEVFSLFLNALKFDAEIVSKANRLTAKKGNIYFTLIESTKTIILKEYGAKYRGYEYEKVEKVYIYKIVESLGDIKVVDEQDRAIVCITSSHEILKIGPASRQSQNIAVESKSEPEHTDYKETQGINSPTLF